MYDAKTCLGPPAALALVVLALAACAAAEAPGALAREVSTAAGLLAAINDVTVDKIHIMRPIKLPEGWGPARPARPLVILSPYRVVLDWCDAKCQAQAAPAPKFILKEGATVSWNRIFFRNFMPHAPSGPGGAARRSALLSGPGAAAGPAGRNASVSVSLDWQSPVPFVLSEGGSSTYNLVVWHFQPSMTWALDEPGTYWAAAAAGSPPAMQDVMERGPYRPGEPLLYNIKSFGLEPVGTVQESYIPMDVGGCFGGDNPEDEQLIYCPYTFKDSLNNPHLRRVFIFHDIGLDRLVNTYRNPVLVTRPVTYTSCRGTRKVLDLDNVTSSVVVGARGAVTFENMIIQGSKAQNVTFWPSNVPLLLSPFRLADSGVITQRDTTMRVASMDCLIEGLSQLPGGAIAAPEVPDLEPDYGSGQPPVMGTPSFTIKSWQLDSKRWAQWTRPDALPSSITSWIFENVTVEQYNYPHCYHGPVLQGAVQPSSIARVYTGRQLLEQLSNTTARYIQLMGSVSIDPDTPPGAARVNRIVEVRACHPQGGSWSSNAGRGLFQIDWGGTRGAVAVAGNLIFNGDLFITGLGWQGQGRGQGGHGELQSVVGALVPQAPTGVVEFEDVSMDGHMPPALQAHNRGQPEIRRLLGLGPMTQLDGMGANFTLSGPQSLSFKQFYVNNSQGAPSGPAAAATGTLSFIECSLTWRAAEEGGGGAVRTLPFAAVLVPAVVGVVMIICAVGAFIVWRRRRRGSDGGLPLSREVSSVMKGGPSMILQVSRGPSSAYSEPHRGPDGLPRPCGTPRAAAAAVLASAKRVPSRTAGATGAPSGLTRTRSGPSEEIMAACRNLAMSRPAASNDGDELHLRSILGEGSYGKVYKGLWRGTVVAVKVLILPAGMSGKERREKMAVMETAISSSLSHPNIVQTFTYSIRGVATSGASGGGSGGGAGGFGGGQQSTSLHDSSASVGSEAAPAPLSELGTGSDVHSWELRLVQEFCDLGSLRDALNAGLFKATPAAGQAVGGGCGGGAAGQAATAGSAPPAAPGAGAAASGGGGGGGGAGGSGSPKGGPEAAAAATAPKAGGGVDLVKFLDTALDIARAMAHLHAQSILHSDLKARNILLKSSPSDAKGFVAKVADFGLSLELDPQETHISGTYQGTMTHMAPELLLTGRLSKASDVYAYAILLWELWTGAHAYAGMPRALLGHCITRQSLRPQFPDDAPFGIQFLACRCWETDPNIRPSFVEIMRELEIIRSKCVPGGPSSAPRPNLGEDITLRHLGVQGSPGANVQGSPGGASGPSAADALAPTAAAAADMGAGLDGSMMSPLGPDVATMTDGTLAITHAGGPPPEELPSSGYTGGWPMPALGPGMGTGTGMLTQHPVDMGLGGLHHWVAITGNHLPAIRDEGESEDEAGTRSGDEDDEEAAPAGAGPASGLKGEGRLEAPGRPQVAAAAGGSPWVLRQVPGPAWRGGAGAIAAAGLSSPSFWPMTGPWGGGFVALNERGPQAPIHLSSSHSAAVVVPLPHQMAAFEEEEGPPPS